ncbi:MAG: type IV toxin-antitoxin system AbiEi family antitoxin domain-containing protein [Mycobacterium sp.]
MFGDEIFATNAGLATTQQLLNALSRKILAGHVKAGRLIRMWRGVYALVEPDLVGRLATFDAALSSGWCTQRELERAVLEQRGRRGIVMVRDLIGDADGRVESPMESEARLVFIDGGLPMPELQYSIVDRYSKLWRVDFAWPEAMIAAEYDSVQWHVGREALLHDRLKTARLQECGWTTIPVTVDDIRGDPTGLVARINTHLDRPRLVG